MHLRTQRLLCLDCPLPLYERGRARCELQDKSSAQGSCMHRTYTPFRITHATLDACYACDAPLIDHSTNVHAGSLRTTRGVMAISA